MGRGVPFEGKDPRRKRIREDKRKRKKEKKVDGEPGTIVALILLETLADIALRSCVVPLLFSFPQQRRGPATQTCCPFPRPAPESSGGGYAVRKEKERNWFPKVN